METKNIRSKKRRRTVRKARITEKRSTWNYRVLAHKSPRSKEIYFQLHEVYYTNGVPDGYTIEGATIGSESIEGLREVIKLIKACTGNAAYRNDSMYRVLWAGDKFPEPYKFKFDDYPKVEGTPRLEDVFGIWKNKKVKR